MKVLFAGVGSIAKRHIRNLHTISMACGMKLSIDALKRSLPSEKPDGISNIFRDISELATDYDAVFITNPTEYHLETLKKLHPYGKNFFIEKPLVSMHQIDEAKSFQRRSDAVYYVGAPLRYNAVIQYIRKNINPDDVISVRSISSSYLPDWRPGQDYRKTYSAHRDLGGGVSIDLIHEWDYLRYLFGIPEKISCFTGKKSELEIDSDDYAIYIAEFKDKIAEIHLDYFGRSTIREVQLFLKDETVVGDIANNQIHFLGKGKTIDFHEERDDYQCRELVHFFNMITGIESKSDDYHQAIEVLELSKGKTSWE